jgi:hypothetical protein
MMRFLSLPSVVLLVAGFCTFCAATEQAHAQLTRAIKTRRFEPAYRYAPSDPWTRSAAIQVQTKHYGFFYNCDDEECKRNSPYIKWSSHCETDLPHKTSCLDRVKNELNEIKRRINDGGCGCDESGCDCN